MIDINSFIEKFPKENRTFKTRIEFICNIFSQPYSKSDIMARCVQHKLKRSFESYNYSLQKSTSHLMYKNPISILKKLNKGD